MDLGERADDLDQSIIESSLLCMFLWILANFLMNWCIPKQVAAREGKFLPTPLRSVN